MSDVGRALPIWGSRWFLNTLSALTFVVLVVFQVWWWRHHDGPPSWVLLVATPALAFVPSGFLVRAGRRSWTSGWAVEHGFVHTDDANHLVSQQQIGQWDIPPFRIGRARRRRIRDGMTGQVGAYPALFFRYTWLNNNRIALSTHYRNVFTLTLPAALPRLTVGINVDTATGERVTFESGEFNDRFSVYSPDPAYAHAVLTPRTIDAILELSRSSGAAMLTRFDIIGDRLIGVSILGNHPEDIGTVYDTMRVIADGVPRFIWADRGDQGTL